MAMTSCAEIHALRYRGVNLMLGSWNTMSNIAILPDGSELFLRVNYERAQANGVLTLIVASGISSVAIVGLLMAIALSAFNTRTSPDQNLFVRTHVAGYFVSLLCADLIQAVGSIMNARWVGEMSVSADTFCTVQGVIKQAADVGTAVWVLVIAIHTFCLIVLQMKLKWYVLWATLISGWSAIAAIILAGPAVVETTKRGPFFGISGYWCWITPAYEPERITLDYMIMFIAAFLSFLLYSLIFLRLRGNILINGWHIRFRLVTPESSAVWRGRRNGDSQTLVIARQMLLYPISYTVLILPIAIARFSEFAGRDVPFDITIFCDTVFLLSGVVNVILFTTTRRILPPRSILCGLSISRPRLLYSTTSDPDGLYRSNNTLGTQEKAPIQPDETQTPYKMSGRPDSFPSPRSSLASLPMEHMAPPVQPRQSELMSPSRSHPHAMRNVARDYSFTMYGPRRGPAFPRGSIFSDDGTYSMGSEGTHSSIEWRGEQDRHERSGRDNSRDY